MCKQGLTQPGCDVAAVTGIVTTVFTAVSEACSSMVCMLTYVAVQEMAAHLKSQAVTTFEHAAAKNMQLTESQLAQVVQATPTCSGSVHDK